MSTQNAPAASRRELQAAYLAKQPTATGRIERGFYIFSEPDGWYGETPGGLCLGPFDTEQDLLDRISKADLPCFFCTGTVEPGFFACPRCGWKVGA